MDHDSDRTRTEKPVSPSGTRRGRRNNAKRTLSECERLARLHESVSENEEMVPRPSIGSKGTRKLRRAARAKSLEKRIMHLSKDVKTEPLDKLKLQLASSKVEPLASEVYDHRLSDVVRNMDDLVISTEWRKQFGRRGAYGSANGIVTLPLRKGKCKLCGFEDPPDTPADEPHYCTGPSRAVLKRSVDRLSGARGLSKAATEYPRPPQGRSKGSSETRVNTGAKPARRQEVPVNKQSTYKSSAPCRHCGFVRQREGAWENNAPCPSGGHPKTGKHQYN